MKIIVDIGSIVSESGLMMSEVNVGDMLPWSKPSVPRVNGFQFCYSIPLKRIVD